MTESDADKWRWGPEPPPTPPLPETLPSKVRQLASRAFWLAVVIVVSASVIGALILVLVNHFAGKDFEWAGRIGLGIFGGLLSLFLLSARSKDSKDRWLGIGLGIFGLLMLIGAITGWAEVCSVDVEC